MPLIIIIALATFYCRYKSLYCFRPEVVSAQQPGVMTGVVFAGPPQALYAGAQQQHGVVFAQQQQGVIYAQQPGAVFAQQPGAVYAVRPAVYGLPKYVA